MRPTGAVWSDTGLGLLVTPLPTVHCFVRRQQTCGIDPDLLCNVPIARSAGNCLLFPPSPITYFQSHISMPRKVVVSFLFVLPLDGFFKSLFEFLFYIYTRFGNIRSLSLKPKVYFGHPCSTTVRVMQFSSLEVSAYNSTHQGECWDRMSLLGSTVHVVLDGSIVMLLLHRDW